MSRLNPTATRVAMAALLAAGCGSAAAAPPADPGHPVLSVCADPNNLPYSNQKQEGFENRIASLLAADAGAELRYTWNEQRKTFFRRTLLAHACDVVISVPTALPIVATTRPYFTSTYVAVTRRAGTLHFTSFDDPALQTAHIGVQLLGVEGTNTPPAMSLGARGVNHHIVGFPMWAEGETNPQGKIVDAVQTGAIDVAFVWGPFGGYFAKPYGASLAVTPVAGDPKDPASKFTFAMSIGVRKDDIALRDRLQSALDRHQTEIAAILRDYAIPLAPPPPFARARARPRHSEIRRMNMRISTALLAILAMTSVAAAAPPSPPGPPGKPGPSAPPLALPAPPPLPWSLPVLGPVGDGRRLYLAGNCYGCHGLNGSGGIANSVQTASAASVSYALANGFPTAGMPSYASSMQPADAANIAAYLASIGTPAEPTWVDWWNPQP